MNVKIFNYDFMADLIATVGIAFGYPFVPVRVK